MNKDVPATWQATRELWEAHCARSGARGVYPYPHARTRSELDLLDRAAVRSFFETERPRLVVDAAAKVGGIIANSEQPWSSCSRTSRSRNNIIEAAADFGVDKLLFLAARAFTRSWLRSPSRRTPCSPVRSSRQMTPTPCQDRRHQALPGVLEAVREEFHLRHADESLRPE